jgi:hypothetical protein
MLSLLFDLDLRQDDAFLHLLLVQQAGEDVAEVGAKVLGDVFAAVSEFRTDQPLLVKLRENFLDLLQATVQDGQSLIVSGFHGRGSGDTAASKALQGAAPGKSIPLARALFQRLGRVLLDILLNELKQNVGHLLALRGSGGFERVVQIDFDIQVHPLPPWLLSHSGPPPGWR